jgi:KUP system potassium uptake protein
MTDASGPNAASPTATLTDPPPAAGPAQGHKKLVGLCIAALGVVYGDLGTSPLYSLRECLTGRHGLPVTADNVLGLLSLVFWSLMVVVSAKYLQYVMRADDDGEGGILALTALASKPTDIRSVGMIVTLGLLGAGLLFGDGIITPAISVLSAVEGLQMVAHSMSRYVVPLTLAVLILLFWVQRRGTGKIGVVFGPIIILWFFAIGVLGLLQVVREPGVLWAMNPLLAVQFFVKHGIAGFIVLGGVFLALTGGEALYADMGHFGLRPIRIAWYALVLPSLLLNYFGQGALLLKNPAAIANPFYALCPRPLLIPMIVLATMATIIASQAVISGVFSLTRQASMLGYWPRVRVTHTSADLQGQIYVPSVNAAMMVATLVVVVTFKESSRLAAAYGIAVTSTMVITTVLAFIVSRRKWHWPLWVAIPVTAGLLCIDLAFWSANLLKVVDGGWLPLALAIGVYLLMTSWKHGRELLARRVRENLVPLEDFFEIMRVERPARVPGTAVFMTSNRDGTPPALLFNFIHNHVVHEHVILLTVITTSTARVSDLERVVCTRLSGGFARVEARVGFMELPDVPWLLTLAAIPGVVLEHTTFFIGREAVVAEKKSRRSIRLRIFGTLAQNAASATQFFHIPPDRVMEIGSQVQL